MNNHNHNLEQMVSFGKDNVDAFVKSSTIAVKGFEELSKAYTSLANQSIEQTTAALTALSTAKSPVDFQHVYSSLAKTNMESFVAESRKLHELANSIVTDSMAPLNARIQALSSLFRPA